MTFIIPTLKSLLTPKGPSVLTRTFQCSGRFPWCQFLFLFFEINHVNLVYQYKNGNLIFF